MQASEGFSLFDFWRWNHYRHYSKPTANLVTFIVGFAVTLGLVTWAFTRTDDKYFGQILGFVSMSIEVVFL